MALKVFDGFDHYGTGTDFLARSGFLQWQGGNISFVTGRNGNGKAAQPGPPFNGLTGVFSARNSAAGIGMAIDMAGGSTIISLVDSLAGAAQVTVLFNEANFSIQVYRGVQTGTLLFTSNNNVWSQEVWNYVEVWITVSSTVGTVLVKVNGETLVNLTGQNTQNTANTTFDTLSYTGNTIDDFYYADTTTGPGSFPCNAPLGDVRVFTAFPIGNSSVTWTPLANTNWQEVSEVAMDGDTSYNFTTTAGDEDLLNFSALANTVNKILGVQVTGAYRKDDATMRTVKQALKSGATEQYGTTNSLPDTTYAYFTDLWTLDPNTSASWTLAGVNGIAAGYNLVS